MHYTLEALESQKDNCTELLEKLKSIGLEAICAGGFPRDYTLYKHKMGFTKARDFDIYIKGEYKESMINDLYKVGLVTDVVMAKNTGIDPRTGQEYDTVMNDIEGILKGIFTGSNKSFDAYELIFVDTDKDLKDYVYNHFDVSICMATFDGESFTGSESFYNTLKTKRITFNKNLSPELTEYSFKKHINKLITKFGHKFKFDFGNIEVPEFAIMDGFKLIAKTKIAEKMNQNRVVIDSKNKLLVRAR